MGREERGAERGGEETPGGGSGDAKPSADGRTARGLNSSLTQIAVSSSMSPTSELDRSRSLLTASAWSAEPV